MISRFTLLILFLTISVFPIAAIQAQSAQKLYQSVLNEKSLRVKKQLGEKLGHSPYSEANIYIEKLLKDENYWNQHAGIKATWLRKNASLDRVMTEVMATDHMVSKEIGKLVLQSPQRFENSLLESYRPATLSSDDVLETLARAGSEKSLQFVVSIAKDKSSRDQRKAIQALKKANPKVALPFFRKSIDDPELRIVSLSYIAENGNRTDLPVFVNLLNKSQKTNELLISMHAHGKWANQTEKEKQYLRFLKTENPAFIESSIEIYGKCCSKDLKIQDRLTYHAATSKDSYLRLEATLALTESRDHKLVPYFIEALSIDYTPENRSSTAVDFALGIITLGIVPVMKNLSESQKRKNFRAKRNRIQNHLFTLTGLMFQTSEQWTEWAISQGYTVHDQNLAGRLFSGNQERKKKAMADALKLLGYRDLSQFQQSHNSTKSVYAELASQLEKSGRLIQKDY